MMLGEQVGLQDKLFYEFDLDERVPVDHFLRKIDAVLDLSWLRSELSPFYSHTGRPSIDPELMIRMLLIGYCCSIHSERRLCQDVELNLAYRWFCRLGLEDDVPDHSTFSVNRHGRFRDSDVFRLVFENIVRRCLAAGLISGAGFAVDASVIEANASRFQRVEGDIDWTDQQQVQRPVQEYLDALNTENAPANPARKPKALSPSDPTAAWTSRGRNKVMFGYSLNYLIDMENAVIVDVEATPTRINKEVEATETMLTRSQDRFGLKPKQLAGDMAYGTGKLLGHLNKDNITPHIPVWDKAKREDGTLSRSDFTFDTGANVYICPEGQTLKTNNKVHGDKTLYYRSRKHDCDPCPLKHKCCPNAPSRRIPRDINEAARDVARNLMGSTAYLASLRNRKKIERLFGEAKRNLGLTRLRLRGPTGARDEFLLLAAVQNLKRLIKLVPIPPPRPINA